jgi:hypothetical protein
LCHARPICHVEFAEPCHAQVCLVQGKCTTHFQTGWRPTRTLDLPSGPHS